MDSSLKNIYSIYTLVVERELTVCVLLILAMIHIVASCTLKFTYVRSELCHVQVKWEDCLEMTLCGLCVVFNQVHAWVQCERVLVQ